MGRSGRKWISKLSELSKKSETSMYHRLKELERSENAGRGVSCIRSIILWLENCCVNENDKIRNYSEIKKELEKIFPKYRMK